MTIVLEIPHGTPAPALAACDHDAALVAQVRNATIAQCQRELRDQADDLDRTFPGAALPMTMAAAFRAAADHLEALRS